MTSNSAAHLEFHVSSLSGMPYNTLIELNYWHGTEVPKTIQVTFSEESLDATNSHQTIHFMQDRTHAGFITFQGSFHESQMTAQMQYWLSPEASSILNGNRGDSYIYFPITLVEKAAEMMGPSCEAHLLDH